MTRHDLVRSSARLGSRSGPARGSAYCSSGLRSSRLGLDLISKWGNVSKILSDAAQTGPLTVHSQSRIYPSTVQSCNCLQALLADWASQSSQGVSGCPAACSVARPLSVDPPVRLARCGSPVRAADGVACLALPRPRLSAEL